MAFRSFGSVFAAAALFVLAGSPSLSAQQSGYFTEAQAQEGRELYGVECLLCHAPREFSGNVFQRRWLTPPVSGIFSHILNTMPQDAPGSLSPTQVAAIVAYILEMNGQPAGEAPLPTEVEQLAQIRIAVDSETPETASTPRRD